MRPRRRDGSTPRSSHVIHAYEHAGEFDLLHDHTFPSGPAIGTVLGSPPVVHTIHGSVENQEVRAIYELASRHIGLVAVSDAQRSTLQNPDSAVTVHNGIPVESYPFSSSKDDYLLFIGAMRPTKGPHLAVLVARRLRRRLIMITKIADQGEEAFFDKHVKDLLSSRVELLTDVPEAQKRELLAKATCTLMPIQWSEPFGLVITESLACGTPVVAFRRGSIPELVRHARTGYIAEEFDSLIDGVRAVEDLDPAACRADALARFTVEAMADRYERVYESMTLRRASPQNSGEASDRSE